jgi:hypothetical protein
MHGPTCIFWTNLTPSFSPQASLERMGLDYVDLVFCHRPDPRTPIAETVCCRPVAVQKPHHIAFSEGFYVSWEYNLLESSRLCRDSAWSQPAERAERRLRAHLCR